MGVVARSRSYQLLDVADAVPSQYLDHVAERLVTIGSRNQSSTLSLRRFVPIDRDTAWLAGFFLAEGSKCDSFIGASNCEIPLIERFCTIVHDKFVGRELVWKIIVRTRDAHRQPALPSRWGNVVFYATPLANRDNVEVRFNNRPLAYTFNRLVQKISGLVVSDRLLAKDFLKGYAVGDGSVVQRRGLVYGVCFSTQTPEYKDLILKAVLTAYGIPAAVRSSKGGYEIMLRGVGVVSRLLIDGWFEEYPSQRRKLVECYLRKEYARSHIRYWRALSGGSSCILDLASRVARSHWAVRDAMKRDSSLGLVRIERRRIKGRAGQYPVYYSLTPDGKALVKALDKEGDT